MENTRVDKVWAAVSAHYQKLEEMGYEVFFTALQGSQNYGLDEYSDEYVSDVDTKSAVLPTLDEICAGTPPVSAVIEIEDDLGRMVHAEVKDLRVMFEMFMKANISYVELLYSKYVIVNPKYQHFWDMLIESRDWIVNSNAKRFVKCIAGMAHQKENALCHPYPSVAAKIKEKGFDGKQLSHAARLYNFIMLYSAGTDIKDCYWVGNEETRQILMNYKKGKDMSADTAVWLMDSLVKKIDQVKDEIVNDRGIVDAPWVSKNFLDGIKIEMLKQWFREMVG